MNKITKYLVISQLKSRFIPGYFMLIFAVCAGLIGLSDDETKAIAGINNVLLSLIPVVVMIYTVTGIYNSTDFIRLLLTQPVKRKNIFISLLASNLLVMNLANVAGTGLALILFTSGEYLISLLTNTIWLTLIFTSISCLIAFNVTEKVKGIGYTILAGLYFLVIYDGLIMLLIREMSDYPVEKYGIMLCLFNPVDMCRILFTFKMDVSALMGVTGAIMEEFLGTTTGSAVLHTTLLLWALIPGIAAYKGFNRRDY